ncbi:MAG: sugar phosphate isomerase/epimerase, partial [Acidobacteriota bacterium]|nr:sugar phosphate isomerase/epimerase [Acidobacteriota bacterium]
MKTSRRAILMGGMCATATALCPAAPSRQTMQPVPARRNIRLGVSTYSYWHFKTEKYPIEKVIDDAARLGFDGVEILHRLM